MKNKNPILEALAMNPTERRPVWVMRQAGRYMKSFREMRKKYSFDDLSLNSELAFEVSMLPMRQYDFDASIVFSDILYPLRALGAKLEFTEQGPVVENPKTVSDFQKLKKSFDPMVDTKAIMQTIQLLRKELPPEKAVLGFAGAPFTLLTYLIEGKVTKDLHIMKKWMATEPKLVLEWLQIITKNSGEYLDAQVRSGADAVQLFDTCAGFLSPKDFETFSLPFAREALSYVTAPTIYYVNGVAGILNQAAAVGSQGLSVDWRIDLKEVRAKIPPVIAIQGNMDPHALLLPKHLIRERVFQICESYGRGPGHILNLGHGIVPEIPEEAVEVFVSAAHEWR